MKITEIDIFGKSTPTFSQVCKKHGMSHEALLPELAKGVKVELEHTDNADVAREIALDHLDEYPDYYDRLEKVEKE